MTIYTFSLINDLGGNMNILQLHNQIQNNTSILKQFSGIIHNGDSILINFNEELSNTEVTELNTVISNHVPFLEINYDKSYIIPSKKEFINSTTYTKIASFIYSGSNSIGKIVIMKITSYIDGNSSSYQIKVLDKTHNLVIVENTFTNTTQEINNLTPLINISTSEAIIEFYVKKTGGNSSSKIYFDDIVYMI